MKPYFSYLFFDCPRCIVGLHVSLPISFSGLALLKKYAITFSARAEVMEWQT